MGEILFLDQGGIIKSYNSESVRGGIISNKKLLEFINGKINVSLMTIVNDKEINNDISLFNIIPLDYNFKVKGFIRDIIHKYTFWKEVDNYIKKNKVDLIIVNTYLLYPIVSLAKKNNVPTLSFIRAYENYYNYKNQSSLFKKINTRINRLLFKKKDYYSIKKIDKIIVNSNYMKKKIKKDFDCNSEVVYPPINIKTNKPETKIYNNIGFINPTTDKGYEILKDIAKKLPNKKFYVFGNKPFDYKKVSQKNSNIFFKGWVKNTEIYKTIDIVLAPSIWPEPFGRISVEAIANGKWTIVSDKGGLPETVNYDYNMIVDNIFDIDEWVKNIMYFYDNPKECRRIIVSKQDYVKKFSLKNQGQKFYNIINKMIN
jgi:glycosyltransferase involved in cell wall biosynthesis